MQGIKEVFVIHGDVSAEKILVDKILSKLRRENGYIVVELCSVFGSETLTELRYVTIAMRGNDIYV